MKTIWLFEFFSKTENQRFVSILKFFQKTRTSILDLSKKKELDTPRFCDFRTRGYYITKSKNHTTLVRPHPGNLLCKGWILFVSR
jgi:hypothetical protein